VEQHSDGEEEADDFSDIVGLANRQQSPHRPKLINNRWGGGKTPSSVT
jgi:hypothetical protein